MLCAFGEQKVCVFARTPLRGNNSAAASSLLDSLDKRLLNSSHVYLLHGSGWSAVGHHVTLSRTCSLGAAAAKKETISQQLSASLAALDQPRPLVLPWRGLAVFTNDARTRTFVALLMTRMGNDSLAAPSTKCSHPTGFHCFTARRSCTSQSPSHGAT